MLLLRYCGIALLAAMLILILHELRPGLIPLVRITAVLFPLAGALLLYAPVLLRIRTLFESTGAGEYLDVVLRALGIALICELSAIFCRDLGESGLSDGISLFGKLEILILSLPLVDKVLELAKELLQR